MNGIVAGMSEAEYHSRPELSSTGARRILDSPARFKYLQEKGEKPKAEYDLGSAIHSKVLGVGYGVHVIDYPDWRSKKAQEERDEARAAGLIPVLRKTTAIVDAVAEAVLAHPTARTLLEQPGTPEASVFATDPETGIGMRARFDMLPDEVNGRRVAMDLKSANDASPIGFAKSVASFGYAVQEAWYLDTLRLATGSALAEMVFIVVEVEPPHLVAVHQLDDQFALIGQDEARRAREIYAECLAADEWPGYPNEIIQTSPPAWLVYRHSDQYDQEIEVA